MQLNPVCRRLVITGSFLLYFAPSLTTAISKSPTMDESVHVTRGYALWETDDLRLQIKPPLSHWLMGSLLFLESDLPDITQLEGWEQADQVTLFNEFIWRNGVDVERVFFLARLPIVFIGLLLGAPHWSSEYLGQNGQLFTAFLFMLSPNLIAFSSLATTDMTLTATYFGAIFTLWRYQQRPTWKRWLLVSICLGLALSSKMTTLLLIPIFLILSYIKWRPGRQWWRPGLIWASFLPISALIMWVLYHFEIGPAAGFPFPIPASTYLSNYAVVKGYFDDGRQVYLLGERSSEGWWHYFGVAFLIKTPIPTLLLSAVAGIKITKNRRWMNTFYLWFPAVALFIFWR